MENRHYCGRRCNGWWGVKWYGTGRWTLSRGHAAEGIRPRGSVFEAAWKHPQAPSGRTCMVPVRAVEAWKSDIHASPEEPLGVRYSDRRHVNLECLKLALWVVIKCTSRCERSLSIPDVKNTPWRPNADAPFGRCGIIGR